mmetsp:Transcript_64663/g.151579  ORF Transcript_64663/g.151579 Transcript_64663/m.151579 type:complete len:738 (-) Transcript_64663:62-2275(-)
MGREAQSPRKHGSKRSSLGNLQKDKCIILPERSRPLWKWDLACAFLLVLVAVLTPFEAGFLESYPFSVMGVFNILTNAFFLADMGLQFFIAYPIETRYGPRWVQSRKLIALRYLRSWFVIDLMSTMPLDHISPGTGLGLLRTIRLLRLLKLLRLARGVRVVRRYQAEFGVSYRKSTLYLLFLSVLAVSHWIACTLGIIHKFQIESEICSTDDLEIGSEDCSITWLTEGLRLYEGWRQDERPSITVYNAYIMSFYTGITILVHPHAYSATGTGERIFFTILLLIGGFMWTQVISRSTAIASSLNAHQLAHQQTMDDLNMIANRLSLPHEMKVRLRKFFLRSTAQHEYEAWQQILERMSPQLRRDTYREVNVHWVKKVRFLDKCSTSFLTCIAEILEMRMFGEQEHFGKLFHMYIMMGGTASRVMNFTILVPGMVWGEDHLLLANPDLVVSNIAVSLTVVEVQELSKSGFEEVLEDFPEHLRDLRQVSVKYIFMRGLKKFAQETLDKKMKGSNKNLNSSPWDKSLAEARSGSEADGTPTKRATATPQSQSLKDGAHHIRMQYLREKRSSDQKPNREKSTAKGGKPSRKKSGIGIPDAMQAATVAWYSPMDAASAATAAAVQAANGTSQDDERGFLRREDSMEDSVLDKLHDISMQMYAMWEVLQEQQDALAQMSQMQVRPQRSSQRSSIREDWRQRTSSRTSSFPKSPSTPYGMFRSLPAVPQKPDVRLAVADQIPDYT